jgi:hypothetical protein
MEIKMKSHFGRTLAGLLLFGISFGYVEAAVVVYLRTIYEPIRQRFTPSQRPGDLFPLTDRKRLREEAPEAARLLPIEVVREAATMIMLGSVALLVTGRRSLWLPSLSIVFGTWDLCFYIFLKLWIDWPASLLTWDILFLIPVPWVGPVLAPVLVSLSIIACGTAALRWAVKPRALHWLGLVGGGLLILASFTLDWRNVMAGNLPRPFAWPIFAAGEILGVGTFAHALRTPSKSRME